VKRGVFADADDGLRNRSRAGSEVNFDITPMIDVTFLLLIFFMVASTMQSTPDVNLPPAKNGTGVNASNATLVMISRPESDSGLPEITIDGRLLTLEEMKDVIAAAVSGGKPKVVIMGDRDITHGTTSEVMRVIAEVDGVQFDVGVRDEES